MRDRLHSSTVYTTLNVIIYYVSYSVIFSDGWNTGGDPLKSGPPFSGPSNLRYQTVFFQCDTRHEDDFLVADSFLRCFSSCWQMIVFICASFVLFVFFNECRSYHMNGSRISQNDVKLEVSFTRHGIHSVKRVRFEIIPAYGFSRRFDDD